MPTTDRLASAGSLLLILLIIMAVGVLLLSIIGRSSPARLLHGKYILAWMVAGWTIGSCIGVWLLDNQVYKRAEADVGIAAFGLLAGLLIGMIHGGIVIWRKP